jgi:hypothetical protein
MARLKGFQRATVDYAFHRLYEAGDSTRRFLVADEVGLGKTLVARGVIARAVDRLWETTGRIDVIYICSNAQIAKQNIARLNPLDEQIFVLSSRLTLLPQSIHGLRKNKLNFVALTPGTSFDLKSSLGRRDERVLLYAMLPRDWQSGAGSFNLLQGTVLDSEGFRAHVRHVARSAEYDAELKGRFEIELTERDTKRAAERQSTLREQYLDLSDRFRRSPQGRSAEDRAERATLVGSLRAILAASCLRALEPDLVILDEFQRFRSLLSGDDPASVLAQELFNYQDTHSQARVLLLSATPYKMYTLQHESEEDDHYQDFLHTVGFLDPDPSSRVRFETMLSSYRSELYRLGTGGGERLAPIKNSIEAHLRRVMCRTERTVGDSSDPMMREVGGQRPKLQVSDVRSFSMLHRVGKEIGQPAVLEYWKSAPYLLNFMESYKLKEALEDRLECCSSDDPLCELLRRAPGFLLSRRALERFDQIDPGNPKLRRLFADTLEEGAGEVLWLPPSMPYYELEPRLQLLVAKGFTKRLVFSSWMVVPKAISLLLSYEAERRIFTRFDPQARNTVEARKEIRPLLRFAMSADREPAGMPVLGVLYPSFVLAEQGDPLFVRRELGNGGLPELDAVRAVVQEQLRPLVDQAVAQFEGKGRAAGTDESWYWATPILLDVLADPQAARNWLGLGTSPRYASDVAGDWAGTSDEPDDTESRWVDHVELARLVAEGRVALGPPPPDLLEVVADIALGGPGVVALRALVRGAGDHGARQGAARTSAGRVAFALRALFNQPHVLHLLRYGQEDRPYWRSTVAYAVEGCIQAVLDEYAHVLNESLGLFDAPPEKRFQGIAEAMRAAMTLRTANLDMEEVRPAKGGMPPTLKRHKLRANFALRYGSQKSEGDESSAAREDQVRGAFNSPFWPFVLASTSIGQEGLDFHQYCHAIVHWNLPSNPVDLEQREGRIHRYKGHAVRKNVARSVGREATRSGSDPWAAAFELASEHCADDRGLQPYWLFPLADGAAIERYVPTLPLSRDCAHLEALKKSLAVYRMVFGQPRQDDLLAYLVERLGPEELEKRKKELAINLNPRHDPSAGMPWSC